MFDRDMLNSTLPTTLIIFLFYLLLGFECEEFFGIDQSQKILNDWSILFEFSSHIDMILRLTI